MAPSGTVGPWLEGGGRGGDRRGAGPQGGVIRRWHGSLGEEGEIRPGDGGVQH